ncbi:hypothetical protein AeMF1_009323 [Aphanomyces euteiches]|nr:hypothetical protein AeMF1_009323 [Aphanomyces euteiches]KAH9197637.1 hypothetical protein AeNC1_000383 [Aphanomyces euteiches]
MSRDLARIDRKRDVNIEKMRDFRRNGYDEHEMSDSMDNGYNYSNNGYSPYSQAYGYGPDPNLVNSALTTRNYYPEHDEQYLQHPSHPHLGYIEADDVQFEQSYAYQPERYPSHLRHTGIRTSRASFTYYAQSSDSNEIVSTVPSARGDRNNVRPRQQRRKALRFRDPLTEEFQTETYFQTPSRPLMYASGASFRLYHPEELPCPVLDQLPRSDAVTKHLRNCMLLSGELGVTTRWTLMPTTRFTVCELYPNEMVILREKTKMRMQEQVALTGIMVEILSPVSMSLRVAHTQKEMVRLSVRDGQEALLQEWYWMLQVAMAMKVDVSDAGGNTAVKKKESKTRSVWVVRSVDEDDALYSTRVARYIANALAGAEVQVLHNGEAGSRALAERINEQVNGRTLRESVFLGRYVLGDDQAASRDARRKLAYDMFVQRGRIKRLVLVVEEELLAVMVARTQATTEDEFGSGFGTSMLDVCNGVEFAVDMKTGETKIVSAFA